MATYIYILCQALDIRALQTELYDGLDTIITAELSIIFGNHLDNPSFTTVASKVKNNMRKTLDATSTMDAAERMIEVAASSTTCLVDFFTGPEFAQASSVGAILTSIPAFREQVAVKAINLLLQLRADYLSGAKGAVPASRYLNKTRPIYEYVRVTLGVRMHGLENHTLFANGLGVDDVTIGQNISRIQEVRQLVYSTIFYSSVQLYRLFVMGRCRQSLWHCLTENKQKLIRST
jgi:phenylalanine ammonia-lyase